MRFIILLITILFIVNQLNAQDSEPTVWNFIYGDSTHSRPFYPDQFEQTSFLTGFQWSGTRKMDNCVSLPEF